MEKAQEVPAQKEEQHEPRRQAEGFRPRRYQRHLVRAVDGMSVEGRS